MSAAGGQASPLHVPNHERAVRADAGHPHHSVFLSANAGSGKTTILTNRVLRLLLDGVDPAGILCLTYTKAAAAEMQDRIFKELARWVALPDDALLKTIEDLTGTVPERGRLLGARRLFAQAIETPGGLKLQTIHAFAERLLHLFPFEANVPFRFTVIDELARAELIASAKQSVILAALADRDGPLRRAFDYVALQASDSGLEALLDEALKLLARRGIEAIDAEERERVTRLALGISQQESFARLTAEILGGSLPPDDWPQAAIAIGQGSAQDKTLAEALSSAHRLDGAERALAYLQLFHTGEGSPRAKMLTKPTQARNPQLAAAFADEMERVPALLNRFYAMRALERSCHLWALAEAVQERFVAEKRARGLADFDDLIARTLQLVADPGAAWVLCKLDSELTHVLVDEAQDTSPDMWAILRELTAEFFAGAGAVHRPRTVFAVGDEKQSIFSFQGAEPESFAQARALYRRRVGDARQTFIDRELKLSFRTVPDILAAVDKVFAEPAHRRGLSSDDVGTVHESARVAQPGRVEIWPLLITEKAEPRDPLEEVDAPGRHSADVRTAARIASHVRMLLRAARYENDGAPVRPGDIMILVQRRDAFFDAVIRALKREQVPVAGADRITLTEQCAVLDLLASARVALLPQDDLSVAEALKGPLIGLDDACLLHLAPTRAGSLHMALASSPLKAHQEAFARIEGWREVARTSGPYAFFQRLLGAEGGRKRLLGRLGTDAGEAIDVFLGLAQDFEHREPPSLAGFIASFAAFDGDVKRDQEQAGDAVRVLTVHGAKGLEARVVFLADAARLPASNKEPRVIASDGAVIWAPAKAASPRTILQMREAARAAQLNEYRRLLYVAMTRARDRLYVTGWCGEKGPSPDCWYAMIERSLGPDGRPATNESGESVTRWQLGEAAVPLPPKPALMARAPTPLPAWSARLPAISTPERTLSPAQALADPATDMAVRAGSRLRGNLLHMLLELLPGVSVAQQEAQGMRLLAARADGLPEATRRRVLGEALSLMRAPQVAALFEPGSRAEAPIAGRLHLPSGQTIAVSGRIDRLLVATDRIVVADFKSGRATGENVHHQAQLALYHGLLCQIYPDRPVACVIIWTREARLQVLTKEELDAALLSISTT